MPAAGAAVHDYFVRSLGQLKSFPVNGQREKFLPTAGRPQAAELCDPIGCAFCLLLWELDQARGHGLACGPVVILRFRLWCWRVIAVSEQAVKYALQNSAALGKVVRFCFG